MLIRGGWVVSIDPAVKDHPCGDVLIEDGRIVAVGSNIPVDNAEITQISDQGCVCIGHEGWKIAG